MRIAVMGSGGIGGYVGGRLAEAGAQVTLVARGAHLDALRANGLTVVTPDGVLNVRDIAAVGRPADVGPVDVVILAVKLPDAETAAASLGPLLAEQTRFVPLQNGIGAAAILAPHVGEERVVVGSMNLSAHIKEPGVIAHPGGVHRMVVERRDGDTTMRACFAVAEKMRGLDLVIHDDPQHLVWDKFVGLAAFSGITCLTRSPVGRVREHDACVAFFQRLVEEALAVARAEGVELGADVPERWAKALQALPDEVKASMLVDLEAGKELEVRWLSGRVCELADRHGIPAPAHRAVVAALTPFAAERGGHNA